MKLTFEPILLKLRCKLFNTKLAISGVLLIIDGYGPLPEDDLIINTNHGEFMPSISKKFFAGNIKHAQDELDEFDSNKSFFPLNRCSLRVLKRALSIAISRGDFLAGFLNGFRLSVIIPKNTKFIEIVSKQSTPVYFTKSVANSGLLNYLTSQEYKQAARRFSSREAYYLTKARFYLKDASCNRRNTPNLLYSIIEIFDKADFIDFPKTKIEHFLPSMTVNVIESSPVNRKAICKNVLFTWDGQLLNSDLQHITLFEDFPDQGTSRTLDSKTYLKDSRKKTVGKGLILENRPAGLIRLSSNWGHFIEDNLATLMRMEIESSNRTVFFQGNLSSLQVEILDNLFPDTKFIQVKEGYSYFFSDLHIAIHQSSRNSYIAGSVSEIPMLDIPALNEVRSRILNLNQFKSSNVDLVFISRRRQGFRKLSNLPSIEKNLAKIGFKIVYPEHLKLEDRLLQFLSAKVIVGESGAGMVNSFFAKNGIIVIELRHPSNSKSLEHLPLSSITGQNFYIVNGRKGKLVNRLRFGFDTFEIDWKDLENCLTEMNLL